MTTNAKTSAGPNIQRIAIVTGIILSIPLFMMQISDDWDWGVGDFIIIGALLFGAGLLYEYSVKTIQRPLFRVVAAIALLGALLLVWAELAVGLIEQIVTGEVWSRLFD